MMKKRIIAMLLCLSLFFCMAASSQANVVEKKYDIYAVEAVMSREEAVRALDLFASKVEEVESLSETGVSLTMSGMKNLRDFADNPYILIECAPTGYLIYHPESGKFVEYAPEAASPYLDVPDDGNLYYGGPTFYYTLTNNVFSHTVLDETYAYSEKEDFRAQSEQVVEYFMENPETPNLEYVKNGIKETQIESEFDLQRAGTTHYITNAAQIDGLTSKQYMGYIEVSGGACGYIATGILLLWHKTTINSNYIGSHSSTGSSYTSVTRGFTHFNGNPANYADGKTFSYNLYRWHSGKGTTGDFSTTGWDLERTMKSYLATRNITPNIYVGTVTGVGDPINFMNNYDRPIMLGGQLKREDVNEAKVWHFVTAYGYYLEGAFTQKVVAHFGWNDSARRYVDGIWTQVVGIRSE